MIKFKNVTKRYGKHVAVDNISFNINEGEFFVLIGPSGCGKTTTLKMINRLINLSEGYIYFKDKPISDYPVYEMRWDIGYVLQQIALFPHMTIKENIAQVPQMKKWKEKDIDKRVDELLDMVGLEPAKYKNRKPDELSGGQRQRVGVIRALAADPPVILMDEPFSALDPISREKLQDDLIELQTKIKKTIIFVTHDIQEAMRLGDKICLLNEGHIEQIDTPEGFKNNPQNEFVKQFMGSHLEDVAPCVEHNLSIRDLNIMRPIDEVTSTGDFPIVDDYELVEKLYQLLAEHERVIIMRENHVGQYVIDRQDMFKFLSQQKGVAQHD
ncbi:ABC transporter ATP-binding protein [Staphylococcus schweitzeri]|uniref:Carnitine transport ATP-binding protein OpuCA n=1 Tax=Staphylococcus schweitzeri TaxID=1654388 RepID=A0A2K4AJV9_9STAP|nr:ABC transporter ATP-binding protein [Staphylococcus schweitzeri]MBE2129161.1 ABC transporter ATP-binding protein [Staphylococcus schweitzeri]PNZ50380.1 ABC transporter ATP-binding protein [Staphylococcus schweitzeri]CDR28424.1 Glycine betaine ABC transport system%2C ATP-binding protein OpuAA [Staphylococcus schweitzeri]CDR51580.1 Glycine betaine ABC transport system%2C ATP-binding protein OpuAA [Staphylococcus schweitzeri]CDR54740.1 Glycine betaine ABC transport system%2C ATP-binding protei